VLAHGGPAVRPTPRPLPAAAAQALAARVARRRQVVARGRMRTAAEHRLGATRGATRGATGRARIQAQLAWRAAQLRALDQDLRPRLWARPRWREQDDLLQRVPGGGPIRSVTLVAALPDRGRLAHGLIAALVGGGRAARAGPGAPGVDAARSGAGDGRCALPSTGGRCAPPAGHLSLRAFYERLLAAGKAQQVALVACRPTLLTILTAMVKHPTGWPAPAAGAGQPVDSARHGCFRLEEHPPRQRRRERTAPCDNPRFVRMAG
jgi:transposase